MERFRRAAVRVACPDGTGGCRLEGALRAHQRTMTLAAVALGGIEAWARS